MFVSLSVFTLHGHPNNEKSIVYNEKLISQKVIKNFIVCLQLI